MVKDEIYLSGRYQVLSKIGAGGMADVYKAKDCMLNRYVAVKVLKKEYREEKLCKEIPVRSIGSSRASEPEYCQCI